MDVMLDKEVNSAADGREILTEQAVKKRFRKTLYVTIGIIVFLFLASMFIEGNTRAPWTKVSAFPQPQRELSAQDIFDEFGYGYLNFATFVTAFGMIIGVILQYIGLGEMVWLLRRKSEAVELQKHPKVLRYTAFFLFFYWSVVFFYLLTQIVFSVVWDGAYYDVFIIYPSPIAWVFTTYLLGSRLPILFGQKRRYFIYYLASVSLAVFATWAIWISMFQPCMICL